MDLFIKLKEGSMVKEVSNFYYDEEPEEGFTMVAFLCPRRVNPFSVLKHEKGIIDVKTKYNKGLSNSASSRIDKIFQFWQETGDLFSKSRIILVWADSDSYVCFINPYLKIPSFPKIKKFQIISNKEVWEKNGNLNRYWDVCRNIDKYLNFIPKKVIQSEIKDHLSGIYAKNVSEELKSILINKILASYVFDGILLKEEVYGEHPIILSVEGWTVPILQNSAYDRDARIPVIELK